MQRQIENAAPERGYRNAEGLLQACGHPARVLPETAQASAEATPARDLHSDLRAAFDDFLPERRNLSVRDREWSWGEICRHFEAIAAVDTSSKKGMLSGSLVCFLLRDVPGLVKPGARNPEKALARDLQRKLVRYRKLGPDGLRNGRQARSGNYRMVLCGPCWEKALALDVGFRSNESLAWRTLKESGQMCEQCADRHKLNVRENKSRVPQSVRDALTPLANAALPWLKSNAAGRMAGPSIPQDWSDTEPGDVFVGDDVTFNHIVYDFDPAGKMVFFRPECLVFVDDKTTYPLGCLPIHGHYNGRHIRKLMRDVIARFGRPRHGFLFEHGAWDSAIVRDESRKGYIDIRETREGFKNMGMLFDTRHCQVRNPRGKASLEGAFNIIQNKMQLERGNVGFNEREEKSDKIKLLQRQAIAGDQKARAQFHSFESWKVMLNRMFVEFREDPQNGARNDGVSPEEHWTRGINQNPLDGMPEDMWWILDSHCDVVPVTEKGLLIDYGKHERWTYAGGPLSRFIGKQVLAYYHIDCPEVLTVFDLKRTEHFQVKGIRLPHRTATPEQMGDAYREIAAFNSTPKAISLLFTNPVISKITRDNEFVPEQRELGRKIEEAKSEHRESVTRRVPTRAQQRSEAMQRLEMARSTVPENPLEPAYE